MSPDGHHGIRIHALDLPRSMTWGTPGDTTWVWILEPSADGTTRLITRIRSRFRWLSPTIAFSMLLEFADIWMIRKMLLNLRARAEALACRRLMEAQPPLDQAGSKAPPGLLSPLSSRTQVLDPPCRWRNPRLTTR